MPALFFTAPLFTAVGVGVTIGGILKFGALVAMMAYGRSQAKKLKRSLSADSEHKVMVRDGTAPRELVYGTIRKSGPIAFLNVSGTDGEYLHLVVILAGRALTSIDNMYFGDEYVPVDGSGNATGKYAGYARVKKHLGATDQTADADLISECSTYWTSNHRLRGIAYVYVRLKHSADLFPNGLPNISFDVRGHAVYDNATDTTAYSANAANVMADYMRNSTLGINVAQASIDETEWTAAAAECNEAVGVSQSVTQSCDTTSGSRSLSVADASTIFPGNAVSGTGIPAGARVLTRIVPTNTIWLNMEATATGTGVSLTFGDQEPRYTINGVISSATPPEDVLETMRGAMSGALVRSNGKWYIQAGAYRTPTVTLSEADIIGPIQMVPRLSRRDLCNRVRGIYVEPAKNYEATDFTPYESATYLTQDNEIPIWRDIDLPLTTSSATAQRLAKIELERTRQQISVNFACTLKALQLRAGDTVQVTIERFGWTAKVFDVVEWALRSESGNLVVQLGLRETASTVYDWADGEDTPIDPAPDTDLPDPWTVAPPTALTLASGTDHLILAGDGTITSRIFASWTAPADEFATSGGRVEIEMKLSADSDWLSLGTLDGAATSYYIVGVEDGESYDVRVRSVNGLGVRSTWETETGHTAVGKTAAPNAPTNLEVNAINGGLEVTFTKATDLDLARTVLQFAQDDSTYPYTLYIRNWETATDRFVLSDLPAISHRVRAKSVDTSGNESAWTGWVYQTPNVNVPLLNGVVKITPVSPALIGFSGGALDFSSTVYTPTVRYLGSAGTTWKLGTVTAYNCTFDTGLAARQVGISAVSDQPAYVEFEAIWQHQDGVRDFQWAAVGVVHYVTPYVDRNYVVTDWATTGTNLTLDETHSHIDVTAAVTITLPTASGIAGREYTISAQVDGVIIDGDGTETINGSQTVTLYDGESVTLYSDGTNWRVK